jgi:hypothetical protein
MRARGEKEEKRKRNRKENERTGERKGICLYALKNCHTRLGGKKIIRESKHENRNWTNKEKKHRNQRSQVKEKNREDNML